MHVLCPHPRTQGDSPVTGEVQKIHRRSQAGQKMNTAKGLEHLKRIQGNYESHQAPAVELQMYPEDPMNATSRWKVQGKPRCPGVVGDAQRHFLGGNLRLLDEY